MQNKVRLDTDGPVGIITMDNLPQNYLKDPLLIDQGRLKQFIESNSLKGLVIQGASRHFSAGADQKSIQDNLEQGNLLSRLTQGKELLRYLEQLNIPTVAAIEGICFGGGLEIALACHVRVASRKALLAFPETQHDLLPGLGGIQRMRHTTPFGADHLEMLLSGEMIDAGKASELRFIDYLVAPKSALAYALQWLKRITHNRSLEVIHAIMQSINNTREYSYEQALEENSRLFYELASKNINRNS